MAQKKIYTAFISSAFESLRDERNTVIDSLLDFRVMPIGMEHFTVSTSGEFSDIEALIDDSDFFIMLMGENYGSCDKDGISWTEKEYIYAMKKQKPTVVIICNELANNKCKDPSTLTDDQRRQIEFCKSISFARTVSPEFSLRTIIAQFFNTYDFSKCTGWTRLENSGLSQRALLQWQEEHRVFDLSGNWYHVHLSEDDEEYIRVGTVKIEQTFTPNLYSALRMEGINHSVQYYDTQSGILRENTMKSSRFVGEYQLQENGEIFGIFNAKRAFNGTFNSFEVNKGTHRGIHDFFIDVFAKETTRIDGEFHDEAPSPKLGRIFLFRDENERNEFLLENRGDIMPKR